jgi:Protein of unknown function, DUF547
MKKFGFFFSVFCFVAFAPLAAIAEQVEQPSYDPALSVEYRDYGNFLNDAILRGGRSTRRYASRPQPAVGSRIVWGNRRITRFESDRVLFHLLSEADKDQLTQTRLSMQALPDEVPFERFHPTERLVFWLNLRNVTVLEALAHAYPKSDLKGFWEGLYDDKRLSVAGRAMSIRDIENHIKTNWPNPLVIYGFYNGAIGGPNIRNRPFSREKVWDDLASNARDFVGSLRGMQFRRGTLRASTFYENHRDMFLDFDNDLRAHMMKYANPILGERIAATSEIELSVSDWYIADLVGGNIHNSPNMTGPAALLGTILASTGSNLIIRGINMRSIPANAQEYMRNWVQRNYDRRRGVVTVDEVDSNTTVIVPDEDDDQGVQQH